MNQKQPLTPEEFKSIYSRVPRLCVDLVIKKGGKYLLTLRKKYGYVGQWHLPGGTVFYREKIYDCAKRVAQNELGIEIQVEKQLGYIEYFSEVKERGFGYTVTLVLLCTCSAETIQLDDQAGEWKWFEVLPDNMIAEQRDFLAQ